MDDTAAPVTNDQLLEIQASMSELSDRVEALRRQQGALIEIVNAYSSHMNWFKTESEKLVKAAGPMLSMMGPLLGQLLGGSVPNEMTELLQGE